MGCFLAFLAAAFTIERVPEFNVAHVQAIGRQCLDDLGVPDSAFYCRIDLWQEVAESCRFALACSC
ncbi:hypothetical protein CFN79_10880 [Chromobacterium vaccinii]|nr:hypothetical protein CFN79_10880 [Chromobacterium vaccinii]OBU85269.1 hypothetical protein MY55_17370 [Chromobacterium subtsugae]